MKLLCTIILAAFCATASAQTIRTLGYNTTNGQVVAATNVVWTNNFSFSTNTVAAQVRTNLELGANWLTNTNVTNFRTSIGLGWPALTNTNVTNFRTAIGLGATNDVVFNSVQLGTSDPIVNVDSFGLFIESTNTNTGQAALNFVGDGATRMAANTRTNLGLGLPALTNTSNVTTMRALAGSTNAAEPYTGTINFSNVIGISVSNGIIVDIEEP